MKAGKPERRNNLSKSLWHHFTDLSAIITSAIVSASKKGLWEPVTPSRRSPPLPVFPSEFKMLTPQMIYPLGRKQRNGNCRGEERHQKERGKRQMRRYRKPLFMEKEGMATQNGFSHCQKLPAGQKLITALLPTDWMVPRVSQQEELRVLVPVHKCTRMHTKREQLGTAEQPSSPHLRASPNSSGTVAWQGGSLATPAGLFPFPLVTSWL